MLTFLLSLMYLLLYAAIAVLILWILAYFFEKIFGPVPPRVRQIVLAIVGLIIAIWFVQSLVTRSPIPAPWALR